MSNKFDILKNKRVLIIDTETTGLPITKNGIYTREQYYNYKEYDKYDKSRLVQISWTIMNVSDNVKSKIVKDFIVKPHGFIIPKSEFHRVTQELSERHGLLLSDIVLILLEDLSKVDFIMAHNVWFDINIIMSELSRLLSLNILDQSLIQKTQQCMKYIYKFGKNDRIVCSGEFSKDILKLKSGHPKYYKMPKLIEFYKFYYGKEFDNQHDSKFDVLALEKCIVKTCQLENYMI